MKVTSQTRFQTRFQNSVFIALLFIIIGLIAWLSTRYHFQADWTKNNRYTLAEASQQLLTKLTATLTIVAYVSTDEEKRRPIKELVARYQQHKKDINLRFVDPFTNPGEVREAGVKVNGELVLNYRERLEHLTQLSEKEMSAALQRLARTDHPLIVFLQGHGEHSPTAFFNQDCNRWSEQLEKTGFEVKTLNFGKDAKIPEKTVTLVIASPQTKLLPVETTAITEYLNQGGNLLWLLDPPGDLQGLELLAKQIGLTLQPGTIIDPVSKIFGATTPTMVAITTEGYTNNHPVTSGLEEYLTLFPQTVGLKITPPDGWEATPLMKTHPQSWSETGKIEGAVEYNEGSDINGPLDIAIALEHEQQKSDQKKDETISQPQRIIVVGDSDFITNALLPYGGNQELAMKMINWLSANDTFLDIPTKAATDLELQLSRNTVILLGMTFLFVLPLSLLSTGLFVWLRRRKA
jgi:ABC-type uncharacterized transport system involved in gliding motility auxiliary subunit